MPTAEIHKPRTLVALKAIHRHAVRSVNAPAASSAQIINDANQTQSGQALVVQTYALSVNEQPAVDFSADAELKTYQDSINAGLTTAKSHATNYLQVIQPMIIDNISNIGNYYALNNSVPTVCPAGSTTLQWIEVLTALTQQAQTYQTAASNVATALKTLCTDLTSDSASFTQVVDELNSAVSGDNGVLDSLKTQLDTIQGDIDGAIAGTVLSGLAIVGGGFMIAVGAIAGFVTAGTSTGVVVGGVGLVATGVAGEVASAITLANLNNEKAELLQEQASLKTEVADAAAISSGYQSLVTQANAAATAATQMENAWGSLISDLGNMSSDLQNGVTSADELRTLWLTAANTEVNTVLTDITTIKNQMAGANVVVATPGQTVGEALVAAANLSVKTSAKA